VNKKSYSIDEAQKLLENYCAYQERSHKEVVEKLRGINIISIGIDQIISRLIQDNYLNESRFAKSFSRGKFRIKKWGKKRIIFQLKSHRVSDYNIKAAIEEINDDEYIDTLKSLSEKIWKSSKGVNLSRRKAKFISALQYRGWEIDLIYDRLRYIEKNT
jgi:regulatory protein